MISFVPIDLYYPIYINTCLFLVIFTLLHTWVLKIDSTKNISFINIAGYFLMFSLIVYMGLRPMVKQLVIMLETTVGTYS